MLKSLYLLLILGTAILYVPPRVALAAPFEPLAVRNLNPPGVLHSLAIAESPDATGPGALRARLQVEIASHATLNARRNEAVRLDGETWMATLGLRFGLTERLTLGVDLPWIRHEKGILDDPINRWHSLFGLPDGDRDRLDDNRLSYRYQTDNRLLIDRQASTDHWGDLRLLLGWQFHDNRQSALAIQCWLKAPTGSATRMTGSGGWDLSLALSGLQQTRLAGGSGALWAGFGLTRLGSNALLGKISEDWAINGWLGGGWAPWPELTIKLQLDSHSPLYDSRLDELGTAPLILTFGTSLELSDSTRLDIGFGEDLKVNASPDFSVQAGLTHQF